MNLLNNIGHRILNFFNMNLSTTTRSSYTSPGGGDATDMVVIGSESFDANSASNAALAVEDDYIYFGVGGRKLKISCVIVPSKSSQKCTKFHPRFRGDSNFLNKDLEVQILASPEGKRLVASAMMRFKDSSSTNSEGYYDANIESWPRSEDELEGIYDGDEEEGVVEEEDLSVDSSDFEEEGIGEGEEEEKETSSRTLEAKSKPSLNNITDSHMGVLKDAAVPNTSDDFCFFLENVMITCVVVKRAKDTKMSHSIRFLGNYRYLKKEKELQILESPEGKKLYENAKKRFELGSTDKIENCEGNSELDEEKVTVGNKFDSLARRICFHSPEHANNDKDNVTTVESVASVTSTANDSSSNSSSNLSIISSKSSSSSKSSIISKSSDKSIISSSKSSVSSKKRSALGSNIGDSSPLDSNLLEEVDACSTSIGKQLNESERNNFDNNSKKCKVATPIVTAVDPLSIIWDMSVEQLKSFDFSCIRSYQLQLPLSFEWFKFFMAFAYFRQGGRDSLENKKGVKALIPDKNGRKTMYGGMSEDFVEMQLIRRSNIGLDDRFLDVGSGIGQVCIQVAATVGCPCIGMEIISSRHGAGVDLLAAFDAVLKDAGVAGNGISHLVTLLEADFADRPSIVQSATVMWFNNFGPWFTSNNPGHKIDYSLVFCQQIQVMAPGSKIFCLNPLIQASSWLEGSTFYSNELDCSWTDQKLTVYMYSIPDKMLWQCRRCNVFNDLDTNQCYSCGTVCRAARQQVRHSFPTF